MLPTPIYKRDTRGSLSCSCYPPPFSCQALQPSTPSVTMGNCCSIRSVDVVAVADATQAGGSPKPGGNSDSNSGDGNSSKSHPRPATPHPASSAQPVASSPSPGAGANVLGIYVVAKKYGESPSPPNPGPGPGPASRLPVAEYYSSSGRSQRTLSPDSDMPSLRRQHGGGGCSPTSRSSLSFSRRRFGVVYEDRHLDSDSDWDSSPPLEISCDNNHRGELRARAHGPSGANATSAESPHFSSTRPRAKTI